MFCLELTSVICTQNYVCLFFVCFFCMKILHCTSRVECKDNISS